MLTFYDNTEQIRKLKRLARERCIPLTATIELSTRCNLKCLHCYNFDRTTAPPRSHPDHALSESQYQDLLDALAASGTMFVYFTGGEPTLSPLCAPLVRYATGKHLAVGLKTHGMSLGKHAAEWVARGVRAFDISLYGGRAETHDAFTQVEGSFLRTWQGAEAAHASGAAVQLSLTLTRHNVAEVGRILDRANGAGISLVLNPNIYARWDGDLAPVTHQMTSEQQTILYQGSLGPLIAPFCQRQNTGLRCECARSNVAVSEHGDVLPCIMAPLKAGNLRTQPFAEIWQKSEVLQGLRAMDDRSFPVCHDCTLRGWCRRSSGSSLLNTGAYRGPDRAACTEAQVLKGLSS